MEYRGLTIPEGEVKTISKNGNIFWRRFGALNEYNFLTKTTPTTDGIGRIETIKGNTIKQDNSFVHFAATAFQSKANGEILDKFSLPIKTYFPNGMKSAQGDVNYYDELTKEKATERLAIYSFTGNETFTMRSGSEHTFQVFARDIINQVIVGIKNEAKMNLYNGILQPQFDAVTGCYLLYTATIIITDLAYSSVEAFKAHLAELYRAGTPLQMIYLLQNPIETHIASVDIGDIEWYSNLGTYPTNSFYSVNIIGDAKESQKLFAEEETTQLYSSSNGRVVMVVKNGMYNSGTEFKQAMRGKKLFYEIKSEAERVNQPMRLTYACETGGTEEVIADSGASQMVALIKYTI